MREIYTSWLDDEDGEDEDKGRQPDMPMTAGPVQNALYESRTVLIFGEINMRLAERVTAQITPSGRKTTSRSGSSSTRPAATWKAATPSHDMIRYRGVEVKVDRHRLGRERGRAHLSRRQEGKPALPAEHPLPAHQPAAACAARPRDIQIEAEQIIKMRDRVNRMIAKETGQTVERIVKDTQRNFWMSAEEAKDYGLVARIINNTSEV